MAVKCTICLKVKGRRVCPRKDNKLICSKCCVELRKDFKCGDCKHYLQSEYSDFLRYMNKSYKYSVIFPEKFDDISREISSLIENKKIKKAQKLLTPYLKDNSNLAEFLFLQGTILSFQKKYEEAIKYFDDALKIFPYYTEAIYNKAYIYYKTMDIPNAVIALRRVIKFSVEEDYYVVNARETLLNVEKLVQETHKLDLDSYLKSSKIFDESFQMLTDKRYEDAVEGFKKVLLIDKNHHQSYGNLGLCYAYLNNRDEAIKCFKKALEIEPDYWVAKMNLNNFLLLKDGESFPEMDVRSLVLK